MLKGPDDFLSDSYDRGHILGKFQQAVRFRFAVNLRTAKKLGLTVSRDFLARVDEIIE